MKDYDLLSLRCFKLIYTHRSVTVASAKLNLSKAAVSKRIEALEKSLGYSLFLRTTRKITPTLEAERIIGVIDEVLTKLNYLENSYDKNAQTLGKIRISCATAMANSFLGEVLYQYQQDNPQIEIEIVSTDSVMDLVEHNIDLTIRVNPAINSALVGKKIGEHNLVVVSSPKYLKKVAKIRNFADLNKHSVLAINNHLTSLMKAFPQETTKLSAAQKFKTNDSVLITKLLLSGKGIGIRSLWDVRREIENQKLQLVLPENYFSSQGDVWLLSSPGRLQSEKVRNLYEYLVDELSKTF